MLHASLAVIVSFSRVYNGVHYPSDVLAGAVFGAGCGAAVVWSANALWSWAGRRWFPALARQAAFAHPAGRQHLRSASAYAARFRLG